MSQKSSRNEIRLKTLKESELFQNLIDIGISLSSQHNIDKLMERILTESQFITNADGGTVYILEGKDKDAKLVFAIVRNDTLGLQQGGTSGQKVALPSMPLYDSAGEPNHHNVATHVALTGEIINIEDAYDTRDFDFSGTKKFDAKTGYKSKSFLTVPLKNHKDDVIGVLQLINCRGDEWVIPFPAEIEPIIEALSSLAAVALDNQQLIQGHKDLLDAFVASIARAIDAKSPHTSGHCQRVPVITELLAEAANNDSGVFKDFHLGEDEWYELHIASWMHDCGKLSTPDHILDKATKLHSLFDVIETVKARAEIIKRDMEITCLKALKESGGSSDQAESIWRNGVQSLEEDMAFLEKANMGGEFMSEEHQERVKSIAAMSWKDNKGNSQPLLTPDEVKRLCVAKGTLTEEERQIINNHICVTQDMLTSLPFPRHLRFVPEIAGGHHEKMDGSGYPNGLKKEQLPMGTRMIGIADIFEALTSRDRPYKKPMNISQALKIMGFMAKDDHIDKDLFELFKESGVWHKYGKEYLESDQMDMELSAK